eukprot:COSAG01_NODE_1142_length_11533_cov_9.907381_10_plen_43_part_00
MSRPFASGNVEGGTRPGIVTEIYLCHARSPQAMLRVEHAPAL